MKRIDGQRVVITGGTGDLGSYLAARLRHAGAYVIAIGRIEAWCCDAMIVTDLADLAALSKLAADLAAAPPDILVNLAGFQHFGLHESGPAAVLAAFYAMNLTVPAILAGAVAAPMKRRGTGQIVNVGPAMATIPFGWLPAYASIVTGLAALSRALRQDMGESGVQVTHINPRAVRSVFDFTGGDRVIAAAGMKTDEPEWVADQIADAILARRGDVFLARAERFHAMLNAISPRLIDRIFAAQLRRTSAEFC